MMLTEDDRGGFILPDGTRMSLDDMERQVRDRMDEARTWRSITVVHGDPEDAAADSRLRDLRSAFELNLGHGYSVTGTNDTTTWHIPPALEHRLTTLRYIASIKNPGWWRVIESATT